MEDARKKYINEYLVTKKQSLEQLLDGVGHQCTSIMRKYPNHTLQKVWTSMERETLKKYLLQFGYGRWNKIREQSQSQDKILFSKSDTEMKAFSNDFIRTLFENLDSKNELRQFLVQLIDEEPDDPFIQSTPKEWGDQISQRAVPWAKRLQLLYRIKVLIKQYKRERKRYFELPEEEHDELTKQEFESWDSLLNFLPPGVFYGQRPSVWWTLRHDVDLLQGTYKYGYATYNSMRADSNLSFYSVDLVPI